MKRFALGIVLLLILSGVPVQADYLQWGVDAARTGVTTELGPVRDDVAFEVTLPGWIADPPLILEGAVYVGVRSMESGSGAPQEDSVNGVVRVDLATAEVEVIAETTSRPRSMASDGERLFVVQEFAVEAFSLQGEGLWKWDWEGQTQGPGDEGSSCVPPAVLDSVLYVLCRDLRYLEELGGLVTPEGRAFLVALDTMTGEERWPPREVGLAIGEAAWVQEPYIGLGGVSVVGDRVIATTQQINFAGVLETRVQAFQTEDGTYEWTCASRHTDLVGVQGGQLFMDVVLGRLAGPATGTSEQVYYVFRDLYRADVEPGMAECTPQRRSFDHAHSAEWETNLLALSGDAVFVATGGDLFALGRENQQSRWHHVLPPHEQFNGASLTLAGNILYAATGPNLHEDVDPARPLPDGMYSLSAFDSIEGVLLWSHSVSDRVSSMAVAHGVLAAVPAQEGWLRVLGTTPASLVPMPEASNLFPTVAEEVIVDLSATRPGAQGDATGFRAIWGDGRVTDWQDEPLFYHSYSAAGERVAEFIVRNEAGQTATTTLTFHVGQDPPSELNLLQTLFAPDNQNMTFGVLGILVALTIAVIGGTRQYQKRSRLQKELEALEAGYEGSKKNPSECEAFLDTRKARARSLMLDGALNEDQFHVLEKRVDDLHRDLRTTLIDARFDFLPHGMVESIKKALADGHINVWEREALEALVEREKGLTKAQKKRVKQQLDQWLVGEEGGKS